MRDDELGRVYADGETICREGATADAMYVVQSGQVTVTRRTPSGDVTIATLGSGEFFGEMALFDRLPRCATVSASGEARVLRIDKKKLFSIINRDPTLVFKILESMSKRIRGLDEELAKLKEKGTDIAKIHIGINEACKLILDEATNIISADKGSVMLLQGDGKSLAIVSAFGPESNPKTKLSIGEGIAGDVMKTGKTELVNSVSLDPRFVPGAANIRSLLCAPLRARDQNLGVINMSNSSDRPFNTGDLKLLRSLAAYASVAIQSAQDFSNLKMATDEILNRASVLDI